MSESSVPGNADDDDEDVVTVSVSPNGQATIPKRFREKLGIDAPGRVRFRETDDGDVVLERVPSVEEMRGFAARVGEATTDKPASELLRERRAADKRERRERTRNGEEESGERETS